ncbi:MAG: phytoene/squalene synthase family protein [Flavobacteriales bacterium]|jgi:15-cis-phytoene synthase|nr:phytoene/squalene synthase family protein [Flavobacteriales bacterium]
MKKLFDQVSLRCSRITTNAYSTSFSLGIKMLDKKFHSPIYSIYGFVRFADEIVDTFHDYDKKKLLTSFTKDTYQAIEERISLNPILQSFQLVVNKYNIDHQLIDAFFHSMELDLEQASYDKKGYDEYIYGSAEVVGLMCLQVFCEGDNQQYESLKSPAKSLGSAFQKINFLRDFNDDYQEMGRLYFPNVINIENFSETVKKEIEVDILNDFEVGFEGIERLPKAAKFGVYVAYIYYLSLFRKITQKSAAELLSARIRISNLRKLGLLFAAFIRLRLNLI